MDALKDWRKSLPKPYHTLAGAGSLLGVTGPQMYRYEHDLRRIPPEKVPAISAVTRIPKAVLRPDIFSDKAKYRDDIARLASDEGDNNTHAS
jgi:hypothetical protein